MHQDHPTYHPDAEISSGFCWAPLPLESTERPAILILSPDREAATPLALMCEMAGYRPLVASSVGEAIGLVPQNRLALMMTDFHLALATGSRWIQELEKAGVNVPVIVLTNEQQLTDYLRPVFPHQVRTLINPLSLAKFKATLKASIP